MLASSAQLEEWKGLPAILIEVVCYPLEGFGVGLSRGRTGLGCLERQVACLGRIHTNALPEKAQRGEDAPLQPETAAQ